MPRAGQRVYWHGVFPDINQRWTIVRTGTVRHEVKDDQGNRTLIAVNALKPVAEYKKCKCGRCGG